MLGAKNIRLYDINLLTKYFSFLKICAYKYFSDFDSFQQFITPMDGNSKFLNMDKLLKIIDYLPTDITAFWYLYLKICNERQLNNILPPINKEHLKHLKSFTPFYSNEGFEKHKSLVDSLEYPEFILSNLRQLPENIPNNSGKLDLIDCSNIIECEIVNSLQHFFNPSRYLEDELEYLIDLLFNQHDLTSYLINSNYPESKSAISVYQKK